MREKWARRIALLTGLLILLLAITFAASQNPSVSPLTIASKEQAASGEQQNNTLDPERISAGQQVYKQQSCARCHSIAAQGNPRNPLDGVGARHSAAELHEWIIGADSLQQELPGYALRSKQRYKELPADELDALVIYMQSLRL